MESVAILVVLEHFTTFKIKQRKVFKKSKREKIQKSKGREDRDTATK